MLERNYCSTYPNFSTIQASLVKVETEILKELDAKIAKNQSEIDQKKLAVWNEPENVPWEAFARIQIQNSADLEAAKSSILPRLKRVLNQDLESNSVHEAFLAPVLSSI